MITNRQIYEWVESAIRKESRGGVFTPNEFNLRFPILVRERYDFMKEQMERTSDITEDMEQYLRSGTFQGNMNGIYAKPAGFEKHLGAQSSYLGEYRPVDLITRLEYTQLNSLTKPTTRYPVVFYEQGNLYLKPESVSVELHYMVGPIMPFLDYYYDENRNMVLMDVGDEVEEGSVELRDGAVFDNGTYISTTIESDMSDGDKIAMMYMLIKQYGASAPDNLLLEYGVTEQIKTER
jgi:hypothetical protein